MGKINGETSYVKSLRARRRCARLVRELGARVGCVRLVEFRRMD